MYEVQSSYIVFCLPTFVGGKGYNACVKHQKMKKKTSIIQVKTSS